MKFGITKRITALFLAVLMIVSIVPPTTFAVDSEVTSENSVVECYATVDSSFSSGYAYWEPGKFMSGVSCSAAAFPTLMIIKAVEVVSGVEYYKLNAVEGEWKYGLGDGIWMKAEYINVQLPEKPSDPVDPPAADMHIGSPASLCPVFLAVQQPFRR